MGDDGRVVNFDRDGCDGGGVGGVGGNGGVG